MTDPDDLLKRAERLNREQNVRREAENRAERTPLSRFAADLHARFVIVRQVADTLAVLWNHWLRPLAFVVNPLVSAYARAMRWAFAKFSVVDGVYDKYRGALAALGIAAFTLFFGWTLVTRAVPFTFDFAYDAVTINLFSHEETLIFSQPQNVEGAPELLKVYACRTYPCEGQTDSIEFRLRDSSYLDLVRLLTRFEPYDPGELAGAFVSEENACSITAYGTRNKWLGWYPYIIAATCRSINGSNYTEVLDEMRARAAANKGGR